MADSVEKLICISEGDEFVEVTVTKRSLGRQDKALRAAMPVSWQKVLGVGVAVVGDAKSVLSVAQRGNEGVVWGRVAKLSIDAFWRTEAKTSWPVWHRYQDGDDQARREWTAPMDVVFVVVCALQAVMARWKAVQCSLVAVKDGFYKLPMGNTYEDGKLCMGASFEARSPQGTMSTCWRDSFVLVQQSAWNGDLAGSDAVRDGSKALFSYKQTKDVFEQVMPSDWRKACVKCNSAFYEPVEVV